MKNKLLQIINNYGPMPQLEYYQSEVWELYEAIKDYESENTRHDLKEHIAEEITDNCVMLFQFPLYYYKLLEVDNIAPYTFKTDNYENITDVNEYFKNEFQKSVFKLNRAVIVAEEREQNYISEYRYEDVVFAVNEVLYRLLSIKEYYQISTKKLEEIGNFKIDRQLKRIKWEDEGV